MKITGIILAAGTSSRMGSVNKLLLKYRGHTVVEEVLEHLLNSDVDNILIVTGFDHARIEALLERYLTSRVSFVYNSHYRLGRAESIKSAVRRIMRALRLFRCAGLCCNKTQNDSPCHHLL